MEKLEEENVERFGMGQNKGQTGTNNAQAWLSRRTGAGSRKKSGQPESEGKTDLLTGQCKTEDRRAGR